MPLLIIGAFHTKRVNEHQVNRPEHDHDKKRHHEICLLGESGNVHDKQDGIQTKTQWKCLSTDEPVNKFHIQLKGSDNSGRHLIYDT